MSKRDFVKSIFRSAVESGFKRLGSGTLGVLGDSRKLRERITQLGLLRVPIGEDRIRRAVARVQGIDQVAVMIDEECIAIDGITESGERALVKLKVLGFRFAPGGAKEILVGAERTEETPRALVGEFVAALATAIARTFSERLMRVENGPIQAVVDREGDAFRVDMRSIPELRALSKGAFAPLLDLVEIEPALEDGTLWLAFKPRAIL